MKFEGDSISNEPPLSEKIVLYLTLTCVVVKNSNNLFSNSNTFCTHSVDLYVLLKKWGHVQDAGSFQLEPTDLDLHRLRENTSPVPSNSHGKGHSFTTYQ